MSARSPRGGIGVVLPSRENFGLRKSGAIALCARDFAGNSRFRDAITVLGAGPCEYPDVNYLRLESWKRWWRRRRNAYAAAVIRVARAESLAMLEIQNRPYMVGAVRGALPEIRLALHLHNDPREMDGSRSPEERAALLGRVDVVYCVSRYIRSRFLEGVEDPEGKTLVIYNGVGAPAATQAKEPIIAFAGRVIAIKGVVELVKAFALAANDLPDWRLVIAGDDPDGLLRGAGAAERVTLLGQVSHAEAMALFARAEIAVVPSLWPDPCPRSAIEALANSCALIASDAGGLAEIAAGAGEIVDPRDIPAFAATLRRVATDTALRQGLRAAARARAREMFDIAAVTATLDAARARLLAAR